MSHSIRSHQKSRKGCNNCKLKRIKASTRRGIECLYLGKVPAEQQARSPAQPRPSVPDDCNGLQPMPCIQQLSEGPHYSAKHLLDLRLMHHYSIFATEYFTRTFPEKVSIALKVNIPRLALEHEFLMDAVLLVSMIHLGCTDPISLESLPVYLYRDQALRTLRKAVADISQQTIDAVRGASVLLATVSFATDRVTRQTGLWVANWLTHVIGQRNFRTSASHQQNSTLSYTQDGIESPSNLYASSADIPAPGVIAIDIQRALSREEHDNNWPHRTDLYNAALELGRLIAILEHPYEESWLERKIKAWAFNVVSSEFLELVRQARPHALVILAYYLALFKFLPDTWTYEGVANHDIEHIQRTIDPTWEEYLTVPKMALQMDDKIALARVFVSCLPGRGEDPELQ